MAGAVQGVGFRPFVHRLAARLDLAGTVGNTGTGVAIVVEGSEAALAEFVRELRAQPPPGAVVRSVDVVEQSPVGASSFAIAASVADGDESSGSAVPTLCVGPDLATCSDCLSELLDPADRRYGYPLINCTQCGPRFTIVTQAPYDRPSTTMAPFTMCAACQSEYDHPLDRRFHAQPNACWDCGPPVRFQGRGGFEQGTSAVQAAAAMLAEGGVVAVQGLGGFHFLVRADAHAAITELRAKKRRGDKPFALMFEGLQSLRQHLAPVTVSDVETDLLQSAGAPIVLLRLAGQCPAVVSPAVAPGSPDLGCMLAYTPLHHLLLRSVGVPLVATSGNLRDEPIATRVEDVRDRLGDLVDGLLWHDREIVRPVDDSVVRVVDGKPFVIRRGRGYAPLSLFAPALPEHGVTLALGAHQKASVAVRVGQRVVLSPHIGDLVTVAAREEHARAASDLQELLGVHARTLACDLHPDYASTLLAERLQEQLGAGARLVRVAHHEAHVRATALEHGIKGPYLGVAWDGTGLGRDGGIHGGEFFAVSGDQEARRVASMQPFVLPGGELAMRAPWRAAIGLLHSVFGSVGASGLGEHLLPAASPEDFARAELSAQHGRSMTSSMGRLFDAVAALLGLRFVSAYEAEAAIAVEYAAARSRGPVHPYVVEFQADGDAVERLLHQPWLAGLREDLQNDVAKETIAARFHATLAEAIARRAAAHDKVGAGDASTSEDQTPCVVVLSGGCFQNRVLLESTIERVQGRGHRIVWPQDIPAGDGGIAVGQIAAAARIRAAANASTSTSPGAHGCPRP